jgi:Spy/CpxP family protein refolding chaperone
MNMKKLIMTIAAIGLMAIMAIAVTAQMRMRGDYGHGHYFAADITKLSGLNLEDGQITKLNALRDVHLVEIKHLQDQMYRKSIELKGLWLEQIPDHNEMAVLQKDIQTLRDVMLEKITVYRLESMNILTLKQQATLESYKEKRGYGSGKGMRGEGGRGRQDN